VSVDFETVGDAEIEVRRYGTGQPLLYLHAEDGLIFSGPLLEALAQDYEVIAPHLPGFGRSSRPGYVKTVRDLALVVSEFLERLAGPIPIVGSSIGAWVALEVALLAKANVSALVLASPVGIKLGDREERDFEDLWMADFDSVPGILYGDRSKAPDLNQLSDDELLHLTTCQEAVARYCWVPYMHDPALRHWARRVQCPVLIVSGSADHFALVPGYYERLTEVIGGDPVHRSIDGAGHRLEEEVPSALARLVADFVRRDGSRPEAAASARRG